MRRTTLFSLWFFLVAASFASAATDVADAAMRGDRDAVRAAIARKADVNAAQVDGTTALHWAVERDDLVLADLLIKAGARAAAAAEMVMHSAVRPLRVGGAIIRQSGFARQKRVRIARKLRHGRQSKSELSECKGNQPNRLTRSQIQSCPEALSSYPPVVSLLTPGGWHIVRHFAGVCLQQFS